MCKSYRHPVQQLHISTHPDTSIANPRRPITFRIRTTSYNYRYFISFLVVSVLWYHPSPNYFTMSLAPVAPSSTTIRPFAVNVELHLQPERHDEFLQIIKYDAQQTIQNEPGAVQFTIGTDTNNENKFHLHEQYNTETDFDYHCTTEHFQKWQNFCNTKPFVSDPIVQFYQCLNDRVLSPLSLSTTTSYCLNVELCIRPEVRDEFISVIQNNQLGSRTKEPLCVQYDYGESTTTPNHFYFHEQYIGKENGKEGFEQHTQSDHFKKWEDFVATANPFTKDPVVRFFESIPY